MTGFGWFLIGFLALSGLATVHDVGKPRKPISPGLAVAVVIVDAALIVGLLLDGGAL